MEDNYEHVELVHLTADLVAAYVSKNSVGSSELPGLISDVYEALSNAARKGNKPVNEELKPAVPIKKSVTDKHIICLEDGQKFKSLKRHLRTRYNLSPEEYRERWGLPHEYPMVSPDYARKRSELAKEMRLGQRQKRGKKDVRDTKDS